MRLIVGLGNPDPEYQWTPHNLGFMAVDELANRSGIRVERPEGKALVGRGKIAGEEVILAKPQTYMNLSGISVRELLGKYELGVQDLLALFRIRISSVSQARRQCWLERSQCSLEASWPLVRSETSSKRTLGGRLMRFSMSLMRSSVS